MSTNSEEILILDFGSQYTQLIGRRIRESHVYSEILPFHTPLDELRARNPKGLILSGGPNSVYDEGAPDCDPGIFELGIPILGICYGMFVIAKQPGGAGLPGRGAANMGTAFWKSRGVRTCSTEWSASG